MAGEKTETKEQGPASQSHVHSETRIEKDVQRISMPTWAKWALGGLTTITVGTGTFGAGVYVGRKRTLREMNLPESR